MTTGIIGIYIILWLTFGVIVHTLKDPVLTYSYPVLTPKEGTYGLEHSGFYWMGSDLIVFEANNPTSGPIRFVSSIALGSNPCGVTPVFDSSAGMSLQAIELLGEGRLMVIKTDLESRESKIFRVKFLAHRCKIESDPRVFLGSIEKISSTWKSVS